MFTGLTPIKGISFRTGLETHSMVCCGPMSKFAEDLDPFLRVLIGDKVGQLQLDAKVFILSVFANKAHFLYPIHVNANQYDKLGNCNLLITVKIFR